jgi:uncharacterized protein
MAYRHDPESHRLPIKLDSTSNGEFAPRPLTRHEPNTIALAHQQVSDNAQCIGLGRRTFMISACGAATTLMSLNLAAAHDHH